jgi:hypothetical protein
MNPSQTIRAALVASALLASISGCQKQEGPLERAGKQVDEAVEQAGKDVDKAAEKAGEQVEKAGDSIRDATQGEKK